VGLTKDLTFTINNTGNLPLVLTGTPATQSTNVVFSVSVPPASTINQGGKTSFILCYSAAAVGDVTGTISIANNSSGGGMFTFNVKGNGYERKPHITVQQGITPHKHSQGI